MLQNTREISQRTCIARVAGFARPGPSVVGKADSVIERPRQITARPWLKWKALTMKGERVHHPCCRSGLVDENLVIIE